MSAELLEEYIETDNEAAIRQLLTENPRLLHTPLSGNISPILLSCYYGKKRITELLVSLAKNLSIHEAAATGNTAALEHLLNAKPALIDTYSPDGFTPLGLAAYFGQERSVAFLLVKKADPNKSSTNGFHVCPVHSAVAGNYLTILALLLDAGAQVNVVQQSGITPLHLAARNGNIEMIVGLLEEGAEVNIRMEGGKLPADLARENGHLAIAEILQP
ncbi:MAG: ankyrin repeat domain-containing protein [Mucilaginibacter polytrichastri]|nr:ankyrin repeat domain-containing protein [Mucilaginibacter polytrichastri]